METKTQNDVPQISSTEPWEVADNFELPIDGTCESTPMDQLKDEERKRSVEDAGTIIQTLPSTPQLDILRDKACKSCIYLDRDACCVHCRDADHYISKDAIIQKTKSLKKKLLKKKRYYVIETSFSESGLKKDDPSFRGSIVSIATLGLATQGQKFAKVTNVTISGDKIKITAESS